MNRYEHARQREAPLKLKVHGTTALEDLRGARGPRGGLREYNGFLLSPNAKTGISLDFPIGETCEPTEVCKTVCYAARPGTPAMWNKSLAKRLRTYRIFKECDTRDVVEQMQLEFGVLRRKAERLHPGVDFGFLRVCGTGDLFPEAVRAINLFAAYNPEIQVWVVTRKPDEAGMLHPSRNLHLQFSLDETTPGQHVRAAMDVLAAHEPRGYFSWLRVTPGLPVAAGVQEWRSSVDIRVLFDEKRTKGFERDRRQCPADAGRLELGNIRGQGGTACARCRRCFS